MMSALRPTKVMPCSTSKSASAAVARAAVVSRPSDSVSFSTPMTSTASSSPLATASKPWRMAEPAEPQAASSLTASTPRWPR